MAKAFKRQSTERTEQFFCDACEEWSPTHDFTNRTLYKFGWPAYEYEGESYYEHPEECSVWTCDNCDEVVAVDRRPQSREFAESWVCGDCKEEYETYVEAQECCE